MSLKEQKELIIELSELVLKRAQDAGCEAFINASITKEYITRFSNSEIMQNYTDLSRDIAITVIYKDKYQNIAFRKYLNGEIDNATLYSLLATL